MRNQAEELYRPYFIFNGKNSLDMGVIVTSMPDVQKAKKRVEQVEVGGRNGVLHIDDGTYENYSLSVECAITQRKNIDAICAWLDGVGEIIFSTELDKKYRVRVDNQISIGKMLQYFQKFTVTFDTFPFKYSVNQSDDFLTLTEANILRNRGTVYAEPIITVYGNGDVTLSVNGNAYTILGLRAKATLDCECMEILTESSVEYLPPAEADFLFPVFDVGENSISWSGNVEKVEIQPNWRWL